MKIDDKIDLKKSDYLLVIFACCTNLLNYLSIGYVFIFVILFIVTYYYRLFTNPSIEVYILGIIACRTMNAFLILNSNISFNIINFLICYLPYFILIYSLGSAKIKINEKINKYKFSILLILTYILYLLFNIENSVKIIRIRVLPLFMFLSMIIITTKDIDIRKINFYLRPILLLSIIILFIPNYTMNTITLFSDFNVLKKSEVSFASTFMGIIRNFGSFYDPRILGIFSYAFLLGSIYIENNKLKTFDIVLSIIVILSTLSRGAIVVGILIIISLLFQKKNFKFLAFIGIAIFLLFIILINNNIIDKDLVSTFSNTFSPKSENNAMSQRDEFSNYALNIFYENPLGIGLGKLKSGNIAALQFYGGNVSDAFWFILLAEIGIFGTIVFFLSTIEIFYTKNIIAFFFIIGYCVHLLGTDIPDMGVFFFAFSLIIHAIISEINKNKIANIS